MENTILNNNNYKMEQEFKAQFEKQFNIWKNYALSEANSGSNDKINYQLFYAMKNELKSYFEIRLRNMTELYKASNEKLVKIIKDHNKFTKLLDETNDIIFTIKAISYNKDEFKQKFSKNLVKIQDLIFKNRI